MGLMDKVNAAAKIAVEKTRQTAAAGLDAVETRYADDEKYQALKESAELAGQTAASLGGQAADIASQTVDMFGSTSSGDALGTVSRSVAAVLSEMPVLTVIGDTIRSRHGVGALAESLSKDPTDPLRALYLAEAMNRCEEDMATYTKLRSVTSLTYAMRRSLISSTLELGDANMDQTKIRLLKSAFGRARKHLAAAPSDAQTLDVVARVYLLTGRPNEAATMAKICISADPSFGSGWVTLARAYMAMSMNENAGRAAQRAVELGAGYGHVVLASTELRSSSTGAKDSIKRFEDTKNRCSPDDSVAYLGYAADNRQLLEEILDQQSRKLDKTIERWRKK